MSEYRLGDHARDDLDDIWSYIAEDDPLAADRFIDRLIRKVAALADSPGIGRDRSDLAIDLRSFPVGNYLIFYRPAVDAIDVIRILSGYRDLPPILFD